MLTKEKLISALHVGLLDHTTARELNEAIGTDEIVGLMRQTIEFVLKEIESSDEDKIRLAIAIAAFSAGVVTGKALERKIVDKDIN